MFNRSRKKGFCIGGYTEITDVPSQKKKEEVSEESTEVSVDDVIPGVKNLKNVSVEEE